MDKSKNILSTLGEMYILYSIIIELFCMLDQISCCLCTKQEVFHTLLKIYDDDIEVYDHYLKLGLIE